MLKLLERNIDSVDERLVLLAPPHARTPNCFTNVTTNSGRHDDLVSQLQQLRGGIYLKDGALRPEQLTFDGRHEAPEDHKSWHLLVRDEERRVTGCIWYLRHTPMPGFDDLRLRQSALSTEREWGPKLRAAVETDVARARRERVHYAEVGGWAVSPDSRLTDCLLLILSTYGLSQMLGGAFVVATATVRHASAAVLRRLGGSGLQGADYTVPPYYDPNYDCQMEILRFDTRRPDAKFARLVEALKDKFARIPVIACDPETAELPVAERAIPIAPGFADTQHWLNVA